MTATFPLPMPDLAVRTLGGAVVWANDETFAEKENLITPGKADYSTATFGHKGQIYDGWETRRRREAGYDEAIVRLGAAGIVSAVIVDTSWFTGNYPPEVSIEAAEVTGFPSPTELYETEWTTIVARSAVDGDSENRFEVASDARWTHVKLSIYPDGGVARLRVLGRGVPDPKYLAVGPVDLAALENGAYVSACSNMFYSSPNNLLFPGPPRSMGEGWETSRRRNDANDWVQVQLAGTGRIRLAELDTSCFLGNAPGAASLQGRLGDGDWIELLPRTTLQPDTRHRFVLDHDTPVSEVRMDIFPDGGMARLRLFGDLAGVEPAE
ncbi:allantoicase [Rhodococcoides fascians]|uniref:Probable allantoicase n=1 Tax=Rhodococcoides fascians TaxID=1828 RepID=A0A143QI48_RHOFA|nr:allantoicase [Rhodococcus fascians]AMY22192.1 allantoicase [Rhodococcus fascians]KMJ51555.1 allantoicase [Rhodococcus fascians]OZC39167.1 allantoicase [Rhodococcus fascians]